MMRKVVRQIVTKTDQKGGGSLPKTHREGTKSDGGGGLQISDGRRGLFAKE